MEPGGQIELLRRQYLQLLNPANLSLPPPNVLKLPTTQARIYDSMFREDSLVYPPPIDYRLRVLKRLINVLERAMDDPDEDEIHDGLAETLGVLMSEPQLTGSDLAQRKSFVTYTAPHDLAVASAPSVTLLESPALLAASGTTGLRTWEAALFLGSFLDAPAGRPLVKGRNVLELGAGTGFVSMFAAKHLDAHFVMATDGSGEVVDGLGANMELNGLADDTKVDTAVLRWGHALVGDVLCPAHAPEPAGTSGHFHYDLILGADVTYDSKLMRPLVSTLNELLTQNSGSIALVAATLRNEETIQEFRDACGWGHLHLERLPDHFARDERQLGFFHSRSVEIALFFLTV